MKRESPLVLDRVEAIVWHIARDNLPAAARWVDELLDTVVRLAGFPESSEKGGAMDRA